jgi:hypothetical protein
MSEPVRVFLGWDAPILPRAARWLLNAHPRDLGQVVVAVPGRRSGRLLLSHLLAAAREWTADEPTGDEPTAGGRRGGALAPPRIVTPGVLPELLYRPEGPLAGRRERSLAWCAALRAAGPSSAVTAGGVGADFGARLALARELVRAQDELGEEGLVLADVATRAASAIIGAGEAERWTELGVLERAARAELERNGWRDPTAARLEGLAGPVEQAPGLTVVLCCLATMGGLERELLRRRVGSVTALVAAPERESGLFDDWGALDLRAWRKRQVTVPSGSLVVAGRPRDQAAVVGQLVAAAMADARPTEGEAAAPARSRGERAGITIGLADPALSGVVGEALADRGISAHDALGRPLGTTSPWRLLQSVARYAETRSTRDLASLVRQPDLERYLAPRLEGAVASAPPAASRELRAALAGGDWLGALDVYGSETLLEVVRAPLPGDAAGAALVAAADAGLAADLGGLDDELPLGEWTRRLRVFLLEVYRERALGDGPDDRALARALRRLGEELHSQAATADAYRGGPRVRLGDAIDLLVGEVASERLAGDSPSGAVEKVGWLELPLDDASRLVVAGLEESAASAHAGGLLGPPLRRSLGLPDADTLYARDLYFLELLASSRDATFVTGRRGALGEPLAPRRILLAGSTPALVETVEAFWGEREADAIEDDAVATVDPRAEAARFGPILPSPDAPIPSRLPATAFRDYLACPYRFYLRHVLALRQVRDLPRELQPGDFGRLLHTVLGRFARGPTASSTDAAAIARDLEALLDEEAGLRSGGLPRVAVRLQLEQLRRRLRAFARWQAAQAAAGWVIVPEHTEAAMQATLEVDGQPFVVTGRIDRVDRHPAEGMRLLDYKSGEQSPTPEQAHRSGRRGERRWVDLQLPLYERMLRQRGVSGALALGFVHLGHRLAGDALALAEWTAHDLALAAATAEDVVRSIRARRFWPPGDPPSYADGLEGIAGDAFPDRERWLAGAR